MKNKSPLPLDKGIVTIVKHWNDPLETVIKKTGYSIHKLKKLVADMRKAGVNLPDRRHYKKIDVSKIVSGLCATCYGTREINDPRTDAIIKCPACNYHDDEGN